MPRAQVQQGIALDLKDFRVVGFLDCSRHYLGQISGSLKRNDCGSKSNDRCLGSTETSDIPYQRAGECKIEFWPFSYRATLSMSSL